MAIFQADGLDLKGFVDLFTTLKNEHGDVRSLKLLSTHPLTEERLRVAEVMVVGQKGAGINNVLELKWTAIVAASK